MLNTKGRCQFEKPQIMRSVRQKSHHKMQPLTYNKRPSLLFALRDLGLTALHTDYEQTP